MLFESTSTHNYIILSRCLLIIVVNIHTHTHTNKREKKKVKRYEKEFTFVEKK